MAATPRVALSRPPSRDEVGEYVLSRGLHARAVARIDQGEVAGHNQAFDQLDLGDLDAEDKAASLPAWRLRLRVSRARAAWRRSVRVGRLSIA
jgi:hypothetical protein